jgi:hypothetical protein
MKISEKQIMQLIEIARDYMVKIQFMIENDIATGDASGLVSNINTLLVEIRTQQSDELKEIE